MTSKRNLFVRLVPCRCLRGEEETVTSLDYSHCSLEQVPKDIFSFEKTLEELFLDANQIEELPKQLFNCQLLHRLSMPDNDLTVLPAAIANLINLRELDISKNSIQEFPENIKNCKVLAIVEASVNPISKLPEGFTQLLNLTQLYLNDAFLEFLPASFGRCASPPLQSFTSEVLLPEVLEQLTGIKELWMDGNRLTILPGMIGTLKQLSYLDVSKNNLEMVDEQISGCENLQDLLLSNNALTQLPSFIGSLKKLTALKVDENQLMYLPDSIGGLTVLEELDCSFNEIEALPPSVGQCVSLRTFAADHNFLTQLPPEVGSWKNLTVLFLHSNKLESLPEEMGEMLKLKVINLSDNKLRNLPFSFTKLNQLTAMWLSENQSKPLIPLQKEEDPETHKTVLTNYMFPQQTRTPEDYTHNSDNESFNPSLWEEQRKQRAQVAFECDEDTVRRDAPPRVTVSFLAHSGLVSPTQDWLCLFKLSFSNKFSWPHVLTSRSPVQEGNLKRYPTPYPDELKNMVKTAQSIATRLKEDESSDESGKDTKHGEKAHVELSSEDDEMKVAEMRPPLIEISINQPKVVALSKDKKGRYIGPPTRESSIDASVVNNNNNSSPPVECLQNGSQDSSSPPKLEMVRTAAVGVTANSEVSLSRSTEELSPQKRVPPAPVAKSQSISNIETGGMKLYGIDGDCGPHEATPGRAGSAGAQGQSIVRSKSASLLNDQPLQVYPGSSASSSDLLLASRPAVPRVPALSTAPPPQYNIQYTSSTVPKESLWAQRTPIPPEQAYLPPQHSMANTNYSNRNHAPPYPHQRGPPLTPDMWAKDRMGPGHSRGPLQRQSSNSSAISIGLGDPRRAMLPDGDYVTYRDIHTLGRGPPLVAQSTQRPLSARTYSIDGPGMPRPHSARPPAHEVPERTMSVSDFNYQQVSPSKRPNVRVKSEHSLLDAPASARVPPDWRDQVMRHIEAKKMEKVGVHLSHFASVGTQEYIRTCKPPVVTPEVFGCVAHLQALVNLSRSSDCCFLSGFYVYSFAKKMLHRLLCILQVHVKIEKNPELGFSISGGIGGRGNPFHPEDNGIFVTRVQPEGPASKLLQPGDKILQANGYNFVNIDHGYAVSLLKTFPNTVDLIVVREMSA
uniref:Erbb2 interacting protein n=1 Tax=Scleropages formosus TaxID=113540 RepID=A0A8C9TII0_SCLFO